MWETVELKNLNDLVGSKCSYKLFDDGGDDDVGLRCKVIGFNLFLDDQDSYGKLYIFVKLEILNIDSYNEENYSEYFYEDLSDELYNVGTHTDNVIFDTTINA